ncbi:MAG: M48 family metalloprotease [Candidatus Micrarchaeia archaeon]|jgi:Zn-dependent protease with chaperone function
MKQALLVPYLQVASKRHSAAFGKRKGDTPPKLIGKQKKELTDAEIGNIARELIIKAGLSSIYVRKEEGKRRAASAYGAASGFTTVVVGERLGTFSENAVRGAIGHELGHIAKKHIMKKIAFGIAAATLLITGVLKLFAAFPDAFESFAQKAPAIGACMLAAWLARKWFSRVCEISADKYAATLNGSAKPLIEYIASFLWEGRYGTLKGSAELSFLRWREKHPIFSTHPTLKKRLARLADLEEKLNPPQETA